MTNPNLFYNSDKTFCIDESEWFTPNTYDPNFRSVPSKPGIYFLVYLDLDSYLLQKKPVNEILYVGSSSNLLQRYNRHEVKRIAEIEYGYIRFYFQITKDYLAREIDLIKKIRPKYNRQHNG